MFYKRRYIQFNELVIDNYDMLSEPEHSVDFKVTTQERSFGHGSYRGRKRNYPFAKEQSVSLTLKLAMLKLPCEYREFYKQFAVTEVLKPGKLWAVVNNELMWAYAEITSYSEGEDALRDQFIINIDLILPEGVWHKADKQKTFLREYDPCDYMDCKGFQKVQPCKYSPDGDCCLECLDNKADARANEEDCGCCCCDRLTKDMALCYNEGMLQSVYENCEPSFQVAYSCRKGEEFFGDAYIGNKICTKDPCSNMITGMFYSDTEMPTTGVEVIIDGQVTNPQISINDNMNIINGTYYGLRIKDNGDVYSISEDKCCETLLSPAVWQIPNTNHEYGWTVTQGMNRVVIDRGSCCGRACAYIRTDSLTI